MNILVYGAGVIGSVYAARLYEAGYNVSLLARGERAAFLRAQGIHLEDAKSGQQTTSRVPIVEQLAPTDSYDVILVTVRMDHLDSILPDLAANHQVPSILFLLNNPAGMQRFEMLDTHRVLLGFPAIGGIREGDVVRYIAARQMPMTLGKEQGRITPRLQALATAFKKAGFSVAMSTDMHSWLQTHAIQVLCIITAVRLANGNSAQLASSRKQVTQMVQAMREGLLALQARSITITPFAMKALVLWLPRWLLVTLTQYLLRSPLAALGVDSQTETAIEEVRQMAREITALLQASPLPTPTLDYLLTSLETPVEVKR